jgi:hypothetical protein
MAEYLSLARSRVQKIYQVWIPPLMVAAVGAWFSFIYFRQFFPPVGAYIAVLAFLAVVVTIWPPDNNWTKAAWLLIFFAVMGFEIGNLFHDRAENQQKESDRRKEEQAAVRENRRSEDERFAGILASSQEQFEETISRSTRIMNKTEEAVSFASGGNSFPSIFPGVVTQSGGERQIGFNVQKIGKYPLYDLTVMIGRPYVNGETIQLFGVTKKFGEIHDVASYPLIFEPFPKDRIEYFMASMASRNGNWYAVIELFTVNQVVTARWIVIGDPKGVAKKPLIDLADQGFPSPERHRSLYPFPGLLLPDISRHIGTDEPILLLRENIRIEFK